MEEPDDDDMGERAAEAGYIDPDTAEQLRKLLQHVEFHTRPGNRSDAALVLIEQLINPSVAFPPEDPNVTWARTLLKDVI